MKKKGFLLIDESKNAVILSPQEIKELPDLYKHLTNHDVLASIRKHKTRAELNKSISEYLSGGWEETEGCD